MIYIALTFLSGLISGCISIAFRRIEMKKKIILMHKQFFAQLIYFLLFFYIFSLFFTSVSIDLGFIELSWIVMYIIFSSFGFYMVQVFYEYFSGQSIFPTDEEVEAYLNKLEEENM